MGLNTRFAIFFAFFLLALGIGAGNFICFAQFDGERISTARSGGEITVRDGENIFAIGCALLGNAVSRVNRFRKEILALNPSFGANDERIEPGMKLKLSEYLKTSVGANATPGAAPKATAPAAAQVPLTSNAIGSEPTRKPVVASVAVTVPAPAAPAPRAAALKEASQPTSANTAVAQVSPTATAPPHEGAARPAPATIVPNVAPLVVNPATGGLRVFTFEVIINGAKSGTWIFVERVNELYAQREAFDEWRVALPPNAPALQYRGEEFRALSAIKDFRSKIDFANQSIELLFSPQSFSATRVTQELIRKPVLSPVLPSIFLNYDVNYSLTNQRDLAPIRSLGALTELGASNDWGILTHTSAGQNLTGDKTLGQERKWVRLETTFTKNFPDENRTFRLGDTRTFGGMLNRDVYFGGIQYGTNFALSPGFISQPIPILTGSSAAQSTVELYINDVLRQTSNVPSGPFTIDKLPGLSGSGEARLVVRDILGRETVVVQPFFTSSQLLAAGLADWRVEAGSVRRDLGTHSNNYGASFVGGTFRKGLTNEFTLESTAVTTPNSTTIGLGSATALPFQMLGKAGLSASAGRGIGSGTQWLLGLERQAYRNSATVQAQAATVNYRQLGQDPNIQPTRQQVAGNWNYSTKDWGSFGIGFASISRFDASRVATVSGNYSIRLGAQSNLTFNASQALRAASGTSVAVTLTIPLGNNIVSSTSLSRTSGREEFYAAASQNSDAEHHLGWRALAGRQQGLDRAEGGVNYQGRYGRVTGDISSSPGLTATRLGAVGGVVAADGNVFATRRVDQSFAVVEVPGYANIGVGLGNTPLTRTDANGVALIPFLVPYQNNQIRLDPQDLPVSAEIDSIEQIAVPPYRSGVKVAFPVRGGRGALLKIVFDDGEPAPPGAIVRIDGDKQEFYVARRGEAFVTGLQPANQVSLSWNERQCKFDVILPPQSTEDIARIGPLSCKGVLR